MPSLYGIIDQRDLTNPVSQITETGLADAISFYLDLWNGALNAFMGEFVFTTTLYQERFHLPAATGGLALSDEYARGLMTRPPSRTYFDVAYPLATYDDRKGWTSLYLARATGIEIDEDVDDATARDRYTMFLEMRKAMLLKTNYTFPDERYGTLNIKRLINGDGQVPPPVGNKTFDGAHTHYLGTNGALTGAFFQVVYDHLAEHGMKGRIVVYIAQNLRTTVEALTASGFVPASSRVDPLITYPQGTEPIQAAVSDPRAIGRIKNMEVRVDEFLPDNYGVATDLNSAPPVAMRQDVETELNGFRMIQETPTDSYPLRNAFFQRRVGFGVRNRLNAVAFFVNGTSTYTDPTLV